MPGSLTSSSCIAAALTLPLAVLSALAADLATGMPAALALLSALTTLPLALAVLSALAADLAARVPAALALLPAPLAAHLARACLTALLSALTLAVTVLSTLAADARSAAATSLKVLDEFFQQSDEAFELPDVAAALAAAAVVLVMGHHALGEMWLLLVAALRLALFLAAGLHLLAANLGADR